jgi:hypothetical protein
LYALPSLSTLPAKASFSFVVITPTSLPGRSRAGDLVGALAVALRHCDVREARALHARLDVGLGMHLLEIERARDLAVRDMDLDRVTEEDRAQRLAQLGLQRLTLGRGRALLHGLEGEAELRVPALQLGVEDGLHLGPASDVVGLDALDELAHVPHGLGLGGVQARFHAAREVDAQLLLVRQHDESHQARHDDDQRERDRRLGLAEEVEVRIRHPAPHLEALRTAAEGPVDEQARGDERREHRGHDPDHQRDREAAHGARAELVQDHRRQEGRDVPVQDR